MTDPKLRYGPFEVDGGKVFVPEPVNLLPCPFCGARAVLGHVRDTSDAIRMTVTCTGEGCWATIEGYLDEDAATNVVASWNRRTKEPPCSVSS